MTVEGPSLKESMLCLPDAPLRDGLLNKVAPQLLLTVLRAER